VFGTCFNLYTPIFSIFTPLKAKANGSKYDDNTTLTFKWHQTSNDSTTTKQQQMGKTDNQDDGNVDENENDENASNTERKNGSSNVKLSLDNNEGNGTDDAAAYISKPTLTRSTTADADEEMVDYDYDDEDDENARWR